MTSATNSPSLVDKKKLLAPITRWEHWDTIKLVARKEYGMTDEEIEEAFVEYQRFLGLILYKSRNGQDSSVGMFSEQIDNIWHAHILCTSLYSSFCDQVFGRFIHHLPNIAGTTQENCTKPDEICTGGKCLSKCSTPPPKCTEKAHQKASTAHAFTEAYIEVYGEVPSTVWNLTVADGLTV